MRFAIAGLLALIAIGPPLSAAEAAPKAKAQQTRYCAQYRGGGENCGFLSFQQCQQALSGSGGICVVAAIQDPWIRKPAPVTPMNPRDEDDTE